MEFSSLYPNVTTEVMNGSTVEDITTKKLIVAGVMGIYMIFICCGNAFVILIFLTSQGLQTITNAGIISLAIADFIVGLYTIPHILVEMMPHWFDHYGVCCFRVGGIVSMVYVSAANLTAISVDRCIGILKPLHHRQIMTPARIKLVILGAWLFGIAHGVPLYMGVLRWEPGVECQVIFTVPEYYVHILGGELFAFTLALIIIYGITLRAIRQHLQRMKQHQTPFQGTGMSLMEDIHLVKTFAIVVGLYAVTSLPIVLVIEASYQMSVEYVQGPKFALEYKLSSTLIYINSAINPVIYSLRITSFKAAMKDFLCCSCRKQPKNDIGSSVTNSEDNIVNNTGMDMSSPV